MSDHSDDWEKIVRENGRTMLRLAMRIAGSSSDAEELVQDAFLKAYQCRQREEIRNWGGLLHRLVLNGALDRLRKKRTKATVSLLDERMASSADNPARLAEERELADQLRRRLAGLPRRQSEVFCLSQLDGRSNREIAEALGIKEGAVATALYKARKQLAVSMARLSRQE